MVQPGEAYAFDMGNSFVPWRRDVRYAAAREAPIAPLLPSLEFIDAMKRWGYKSRLGLFEVNTHDTRLIAQAMQADMQTLGL